jgi:glycosyltransferase involved in cell wall biosynthesis
VNALPRVLIWTSIPTHHQSAFFAALRARGFDLTVLYFSRVDTDRQALGWNAHPDLPPGEHYVARSLRALSAAPDWTERIHILPGYSNPLLLRLAALFARRGIPWLHWGEHSERKPRSHLTWTVKQLYGQLIRRSALGALAIGDLARREFISWGVLEERIRFLPYAVAGFPEFYRSVRPDERAPPRFLFIGQLIPRKGIDVLLGAMKIVHAHCPGARLELVGTDPMHGAYQRQARVLGLEDAVTFTGAVPAPEVGLLLARCDVFVLPSRHDGWGVVVNEAVSAGKAVIASEGTGAAHHLVIPRLNGFRFATGDASDLAGAMLRYCADPWLARDHGLASARLFTEFTPQRNARRLEEALATLTAPTAVAERS